MQYRCHCTVEALRAAGATDEILAVTKALLIPVDQGDVGLFEQLHRVLSKFVFSW